MNRKTLISVIIAALIIIAGTVFVFVNYNSWFSGNQIYYSQNNPGKYIQLKKDHTFAIVYNPQLDIYSEDGGEHTNIEARIENTGTWSKTDDKITLNFDGSQKTVEFVKTKEGIYNSSKIFKGIYTDKKLLNGIYTYKVDDEFAYRIVFFDDLTMNYDTVWGREGTPRHGTYTRINDIITVRYNDSPERPYKYLMTNHGIADDYYTKEK